MKNQKFIQWTIIALAIVLILINRKAIAKEVGVQLPTLNGTTPSTASEPNTTTATQAGGLDFDLLLSAGSKGAEVKQLQTWINTVGYTPPLVADGIFGIKTTNAVKKYNGGASTITLRQALNKMSSLTGFQLG